MSNWKQTLLIALAALVAGISGVLITRPADEAGMDKIFRQLVVQGPTTIYDNLLIDSDRDAIQLRVQGHSTQTNNLVTVENSAGTDLFTITNAGVTTVDGNLVVTGTIDAQGDVAFRSTDYTINRNVVITGTLDQQGAISDSNGDLTVNDNVVITGTLDPMGAVAFRSGTDLTINRNVVITGTLDTASGGIANVDLAAPNALYPVTIYSGATITNTSNTEVWRMYLPVASTGVSATVVYQGVTGDTGDVILYVGDDGTNVVTLTQTDPASGTAYNGTFTSAITANSLITATVLAPAGKGVTGAWITLWLKAAHQ